jgi:hypothetical protein
VHRSREPRKDPRPGPTSTNWSIRTPDARTWALPDTDTLVRLQRGARRARDDSEDAAAAAAIVSNSTMTCLERTTA